MYRNPPDPPAPPQSPEREKSFVERHRIHPVVFAVISLAAVFVLYQVIAGTITFLLVGGSTVNRENVNLLRLLTVAGQIFCILIPTIILARLFSRRPSAEVFSWRIPSLAETVYALLGLVVLQQIFQIYLFFQDLIPVPDFLERILDPFKEKLEEMFRELVRANDLPELSFVLLVVAVVPAVVEELLFRGLIQKSLEKAVPAIQAALLSGIIFGMYHFNPFAVVPLVGLGCYFGFLRYRSASIVIAMTAHFLNNALAALAVYFQMEHETILGAQPDIEPNIVSILVQLLLYLTLFFLTFYGYLRATLKIGPHANEV